MGDFFSVQPDRFYIAAIIAASLWSAITTGRFLQPEDRRKRLALLGAIFALFWIGPLYDFGQREHIAVILALPYCALILKRRQDEPVGRINALLIGIAAACGFALKHYFILVPAALELWLFCSSNQSFARRFRAMFRPETIMLAIIATSYAGIVIIFMPAFLGKMVPLVMTAYAGYEQGLWVQLGHIEVFIWLFSLVSAPALRRTLDIRDRNAGDMLIIAGIAFMASYFLQQKGWHYHAIPGTVLLALASFHYLSCQKLLAKAIVLHPAAFLAALLFVPAGIGRGPYNSAWAAGMPHYFAQAKSGESILLLTTDPRRIFPFTEQYNLIWPSRYFSFWMISAIAEAEIGKKIGISIKMTPALEKVGADIRRETLEDMKCHPPAMILSQIRSTDVNISPTRFRITDFFRRDPAFSSYLAKNYRLEKADRLFETYRRITPPEISGKGCYRIY